MSNRVLKFTPRAWVQMWRLTRECPVEISAMGILHEADDFLVTEFFVPSQQCTGVYTEMDDKALADLSAQLTAGGHDLARMRVFWHSHVNMSTGPSGTDLKTFDRLANGGFLWSIITNKEGATKALSGQDPGNGMMVRLDTYDPVKHDNYNSLYRNTITDCRGQVVMDGVIGSKWVKDALAQVRPMSAPVLDTRPARQWGTGDVPGLTWRREPMFDHQPAQDKKLVQQVGKPVVPSNNNIPEKGQKQEALGYWSCKWLYAC
jgi:hypothetical protein